MAHKRSRATFEADLQARQSPYVIYGTPLPLLDPDVRDDGSYVPLWKQEVTDDQGRKRLHGAFTGGFSAGYFNTVGSKEGWTPSTFTSSRSNRQKDGVPHKQRPEDYMDDEDIADAEEAQSLQTADAFSGVGSATGANPQTGSFAEIMRATGETIGAKLLKKMGWREGQGVGPKVRRAAITDKEQTPDQETAEETFLFAPENSSMISFEKKHDRKGLGFESWRTLGSELSGEDKATKAAPPIYDHVDESGFGTIADENKNAKKGSQSKGGFGTGVLNDNGSDDEDPYQMGPQISYNRVVTSNKKKQKDKKLKVAKSSANPLLQSKPVFISKKKPSLQDGRRSWRCHDGRLPISGFVLADSAESLTSSPSREVQYPPPVIPEGWKSMKVQPSSAITSSTIDHSVATKAAVSKLSPKSRAALLGESQLPGKSVFDYLTPDARSQIALATNNPNLPPALGEAENHLSSSQPRNLQTLVPSLLRETAIKALGRGTAGWMPYAEDLTKRARYRLFLEIRAGLRPEGTLPDRAPGTSNDEWGKEMNEFAHAAQIFKPMTGMMATRFTSSSSASQPTPDDVKSESTAGSNKGEQLLGYSKSKITNPTEEAAAVGMYGPLTRDTKSFFPTRLLCKRFNVKPPAHVHVDAREDPIELNVNGNRESRDLKSSPINSTALSQKKLELIGKRDMDNLRISSGVIKSPCLTTRETVSVDGDGARLEHEREPAVNSERNEAIEKERPEEAVFKAIFGSDSEDE